MMCVCVRAVSVRIGYTTPTRTIHISSAISSYSEGYVTMVAEDKRVHIVRVHVGVVYLTYTQGSIIHVEGEKLIPAKFLNNYVYQIMVVDCMTLYQSSFSLNVYCLVGLYRLFWLSVTVAYPL